MKKLDIKYMPPPVDVLIVDGVRYSGDFFRGFATSEIKTCLQIVKREDGVLHVKRLPKLNLDYEKAHLTPDGVWFIPFKANDHETDGD